MAHLTLTDLGWIAALFLVVAAAVTWGTRWLERRVR
jgi:hypothetical protein